MSNELKKYEKAIYTQCKEDGVLEHIFSKIGKTNLMSVEFGM